MSDFSLPMPPAPVGQPSAFASHRASNRRLSALIVVSMLMHASGIAAYVFVDMHRPPVINLDNTVRTHLVKLGKQRDEKLLPRLEASPPPMPAESKAPIPVQAEPTKAEPAPAAVHKRSAADILEKFEQKNEPRDVNDLIKKRIGEPTDQGHEQGDAAGTDLTGDLQKTYAARLIAHIRARMRLSDTLADEERVRLQATISVRIGSDGNVIDVRIADSSGSPVYDNDVIDAVKRSEPVPAPPIQLRAQFSSGVKISFCPSTCK